MSEEAENEQLTIRIKDGVSALLAGGARLAGHVLCAAGERPTAGSAGTCWVLCLFDCDGLRPPIIYVHIHRCPG